MIITKGLMYAGRTYAEKTALIDGERQFTYGQLKSRVSKVKQSLQELGVKKGDRVGFLMLNDFRIIELMFGITALGSIVVPLNTRFTAAENAYVLNDAGIQVLYIHKEFLSFVPEFRKNVSELRHIIIAENQDIATDHVEDDILSYETLLENQPDTALTYDDVQEDDVAGLFYTGGTTGKSKGVMLTHKNLVINAYHVIVNCKFDHNDIYLHAAPMFHLADQATTFAVTMTGGTHVTLRQFHPAKVLETIEKERITAGVIIPTMLNMILHESNISDYDTSSFRLIIYGASPMSIELIKKSSKLLPHTQLLQIYGMTEAAPVLTVLRPEDHVLDGTAEDEARLASCGKPVQNVEMKVIAPEGIEAMDGEVGEIIVQGPNIMKGYWNLPEETAVALADGWYHTGDMGYKDADGFYYIVDRAKDMIISGGENVYSIEVEQALSYHPAILECAVYGVPDEKWGERVTAGVVLKSEATEEEIVAFLKGKIADYKIPKTINILEDLPKSGAGKILKRTLRDQYWVNEEKRVH